jgi:hypothetical protein
MILRRLITFFVCTFLFVQAALSQLTYETLYVAYDSAWTYKNLQLIPIYFKGPGGAKAEILSTQQGLRQKILRIKEVDNKDGADKAVLKFTNKGKKKIMLNSGELLSGGKQDRVIAETKIIDPGSTEYVSVFCIEKGRWDDDNKAFTYRGMVDGKLKKVMDLANRQHDIWKEIDRRFSDANKFSPTWSYLELYKKPVKADSNYINYFLQKYNDSDSSFAGFIAVSGDQILQTEIFGTVSMTNIAFSGMLNSLVNKVSEDGGRPSLKQDYIRPVMDRLLQDEVIQKAYVGQHGKMHYYEERVIHIVVYDL